MPIMTYTGNVIDFNNLRPETINIHDIAHALSNLCRFSGMTRTFYSVAQHSIRVSHMLPPHLKLYGLLHDATEAYLADMPAPVKKLCPDYQELEDRVWATIAAHFGLPAEQPALIKSMDNALLRQEFKEHFDHQPPEAWFSDTPGIVVPWEPPISPERAEAVFLYTFGRLYVESRTNTCRY